MPQDAPPRKLWALEAWTGVWIVVCEAKVFPVLTPINCSPQDCHKGYGFPHFCRILFYLMIAQIKLVTCIAHI